MFKKISVPLMFLSLGILSVNCGSDGGTTGTGGKGAGGKGTGGSASGGSGTGGSASGGSGTGGAASGGAAGGENGGAAGGANGGAAGGANGGAAGGANGGAAGGANGGAAGGANGGAGGRGGAAGGANGGAAGGAAGGANGGAGGTSELPACTSTMATSTPLSAADFCKDLIATCTGVTGYTPGTDYGTQSACETAYAASPQKMCQSYHLCGNAFGKTASAKMSHCPHAVRMGGQCM